MYKKRVFKRVPGLWIYIILFPLIFSCNYNKKYLIPEKKFINLLTDLHVAEAIGSESKRDLETEYKIDSASLYGSVFKKHGVNRAMFDSTLLYYSKRPEKFEKLYNAVTAQLKKMEEMNSAQLTIAEQEKEDILYKDEHVYRFPPLAGYKIPIDVPINGPGIYSVWVTVKMLSDDATLDPRLSVYFYRDNGTEEGAKIRLQEYRYTLRTGIDKTYKVTRQLDSANYSHIKGNIVNYSNTDTFFKRNMVVKDIMVMKRKEE